MFSPQKINVKHQHPSIHDLLLELHQDAKFIITLLLLLFLCFLFLHYFVTYLCFSQLTLRANMPLAIQRTLKLPASEAVHHIMTFDPNDSNFLYVMTSHHVSAQLQTRLQMYARSLN